MASSFKQCIIYLSNSDYISQTGGTEKFLSEIIAGMRRSASIHSVQIFPVRRLNRAVAKIFKSNQKEYADINIDGKYYGMFSVNTLASVLRSIEIKYRFAFQGVMINQITFFDGDMLADQLLQLDLPIKYVVHDFTAVCPYIFYPGRTSDVCERNLVIPSLKNCGNCNYLDAAIKNYTKTKTFLDRIKPNLESFIFPSQSTCELWNSVFPFYCESLVRPHLSYETVPVKRKMNDKLRIAFLGQPARHKGVDEWKTLVQTLDSDQFEFYYLGSSDLFSDSRKIQSYAVDYRDPNALSMQEQLTALNIDIVFLWSKCKETYGYTLFEAMQCGCYVVTNAYSGNIADVVNQNQNGAVFSSFQECLQWFLSGQAERAVGDYCATGMQISNAGPNSDLTELKFTEHIPRGTVRTLRYPRNPVSYMIGKMTFFQG